jgi:uncharacterized cofD-like protein
VSGPSPSVVAIGGGHGLAVTLRACRPWAGSLTAVVSVADDGGSSGRLRADHPGLPAPGDLRRCLTTLAAPEHELLAAALERRFEVGDLAGHPAGNVLLASLVAECGDLSTAAAVLAASLGVDGTVLPCTDVPVHLVARTAGGEVVGQVAVEAAGAVEHLRLEPRDPATPAPVLEAVAAADLVVLGPGSFYGSVLAALAAPSLQRAVAAADGVRVLVHNLFAVESVDHRVRVLADHGIPVDEVLVHGPDADLAQPSGLAHHPEKLGSALCGLSARSAPSR